MYEFNAESFVNRVIEARNSKAAEIEELDGDEAPNVEDLVKQ